MYIYLYILFSKDYSNNVKISLVAIMLIWFVFLKAQSSPKNKFPQNCSLSIKKSQTTKN